MKSTISFFLFIIILIFSSCKEEEPSENIIFKEDPNNFFTATFGGKTLKTSGFIFTINGITDDLSGSASIVNAILETKNINGSVQTDLICSVQGSLANSSFNQLYKIPLQQLDAFIWLERSGNAVGTYKIDLDLSSITDLTVGNKKYDIDPATTTFNVTSADILWIQGTYTGNLLDGSKKIPVTGSFRLRKL
jgi:hypothetical protein